MATAVELEWVGGGVGHSADGGPDYVLWVFGILLVGGLAACASRCTSNWRTNVCLDTQMGEADGPIAGWQKQNEWEGDGASSGGGGGQDLSTASDGVRRRGS